MVSYNDTKLGQGRDAVKIAARTILNYQELEKLIYAALKEQK